MNKFRVAALCVLIGGVAACSDGSDSSRYAEEPGVEEPGDGAEQPASLDEELRSIIADMEITGNPAAGRELPTIDEPMPQLGMKLFFSKALSGQMDTACVTCHHPALGGGDDLSLSIGVDAEFSDLLGPGRKHSSSGFHHDGGPTVPRNAPTTFYIALWDQVLFHDGRVESLGKTAGKNGDDGQGIRTPDTPFGEPDAGAENLTQAQALFPVTSAEEMRARFLDGASNQEIRDGLAGRIVSQEIPNTWLEEFQQAYNSTASAEELITYQNISTALAEYERSQVFVDTPWRSYVEGDDAALSEAAKRGAKLFYSSVDDGGADCVACHSGDFFTDEQFHVLAMPQVGRGKGDGEFGDDDFGRFRETGEEVDRYAFRTPSLLSVTATGPWTHSGSYLTLEEVVRHHIDPEEAVDAYDFSLVDLDPMTQGQNAEVNTRQALAKLQGLQESGESQLPVGDLTDEGVSDLIAFIGALTDPCVENAECIGQWVPSTTEVGPDSLQLNGVNEDGDPL